MTTRGLRPAMAWIHGWLGLLAGWILFVMFLTGTASYFRSDITRWMQPERHAGRAATAQVAAAAVRTLQARDPADEWSIFLPGAHDSEVHAFVRGGRAGRSSRLDLDPATGAPVIARATEGGDLFFALHYTLYLPGAWGEWLCGACAMAMLSAIVSGVITHKRIFADVFTLRWGKGRRSWLDAHNLAAVLGLPYHAVITYSGLITLATLYMPLPLRAAYPDTAAFYAQAYRDGPEMGASGHPAALVPIAGLVEDAERRWHGVPASSVTIQHPGDAGAIVTIVAQPGGGVGARGSSLTYAGASGWLIGASPPDGSGLGALKSLFGLHLGYFAGPGLRVILFLLGLTGTAMVGTGLCLWSAKRTREASLGHRLVERLTIGVVACLPAGMAAYFLANRLIPADAAGRAHTEVTMFFGVWAGLALSASLRPVRRGWIETLGIAGVLFAAVPAADVATVGWPRDMLFAGFDGTMIAAAVLLAFGSRRVARPIVPHLHIGRPAHVG